MTPINDLLLLAREHGLSMSELAARAGLPRSTVSDFAIGKRHPHHQTMEKLRAVIGGAQSKNSRPDLEPGFWPEYREPTELGRAIQYPLSDPHWQNRVINAYRKTRPGAP